MMKNSKPRKDGGYIINVSFTDKELDLIEYVDSKGNFSNYVKLLIRKDMEGATANNSNIDLAKAMQQLLKMAGEQTEQKEEKPKEEKKQKVNKLAINNILGKNYK